MLEKYIEKQEIATNLLLNEKQNTKANKSKSIKKIYAACFCRKPPPTTLPPDNAKENNSSAYSMK